MNWSSVLKRFLEDLKEECQSLLGRKLVYSCGPETEWMRHEISMNGHLIIKTTDITGNAPPDLHLEIEIPNGELASEILAVVDSFKIPFMVDFGVSVKVSLTDLNP